MKLFVIIMGSFAVFMIVMIFIATCFVSVGPDDYVFVKNWKSEEIEVLEEEGIYFRPFNERLVFPKTFILEYKDKEETE